MNSKMYLLCGIALCCALQGCSTYRPVITSPSANFDDKLSLGNMVLTLEQPLKQEPQLKATFQRKTLKQDYGIVGTYVFFLPYPRLSIDQTHEFTELSGEMLSEHAWRFKLPRMQWWGEPKSIAVSYSPVGGRVGSYLLFQVLQAEQCLADYTLEDVNGHLVRVSTTLKDGLCLLPCSPSVYDPRSCGNSWLPAKP